MQINKPQRKDDVLKAQRLQKRDKIFRDAIRHLGRITGQQQKN